MTPNYQLPLEAETSPGWERLVAGSDLSRRHGHVAQDDDRFIRSCLGRHACPKRRLARGGLGGGGFRSAAIGGGGFHSAGIGGRGFRSAAIGSGGFRGGAFA